MSSRIYRKAALVAVAAPTIALLGATQAFAAPQPLTPTYALDETTPAATAHGAVGFRVISSQGVPIDDVVALSLAGGTSTYQASFRDVGAATGRLLPSGAIGSFTLNTDLPASSYLSQPASGQVYPDHPMQPPVGTSFSDSWIHAGDTGTYTYQLDFTTLAGGALPVGSVLFVNDVDGCVAGSNERASLQSSAGGSWLNYYSDDGVGALSPVSHDPDTGEYVIDSSCGGGYAEVTQSFVTTVPVTDVTIALTPSAIAGSGLWWGLNLPLEAATPLLEITGTVNGGPISGSVAELGDELTWEYELTNAGNTWLKDVRFSLDNGATLDCDMAPIDLAPGESASCSAVFPAESGEQTIAATATGTALNGVGEVFAIPVSQTLKGGYTVNSRQSPGTPASPTPPVTPDTPDEQECSDSADDSCDATAEPDAEAETTSIAGTEDTGLLRTDMSEQVPAIAALIGGLVALVGALAAVVAVVTARRPSRSGR